MQRKVDAEKIGRKLEEIQRMAEELQRSVVEQSAGLEVTVFDLVGVVGSKVRDVRLEHGDFEVEDDLPPYQVMVSGIRPFIKSAVDNVINNAVEAIRAAAGRRLLFVGCEVKRQDAELWGVVRVRDTGNGIPVGILPNIWKEGVSTKGAGRGTGLTRALEAVEGAGGTIEIESTGSEGTVVCLRLPMVPSREL